MSSVRLSVVTATVSREDLLERCVASVLEQTPGFLLEHIVVNDSGTPLTPAPWMRDPRVRILDTQRVERCAARNAGASVARGEWLYFLDDDDYALPGALSALLAAAAAGQPVLLYGGYWVSDETARTLEDIVPKIHGDVFPQMLAGEAFPTHAVWLRRDTFFAAAGFDLDMVYAEDVDLFRRMAFLGSVARTEHLVAVARIHHLTTTTDPALRHVRWWQSLEKCLANGAVLSRVLAATRHSPYWQGRCAREYWASAARNLRARRYAPAFSRVLAARRLTHRHLLRAAFWWGLGKSRTAQPLLGDGSGSRPAKWAKKRPMAV